MPGLHFLPKVIPNAGSLQVQLPIIAMLFAQQEIVNKHDFSFLSVQS